MKIESLTPHLGAKVWGIDLSEPMSDETLSQIQALMRDWSVLVFPEQDLSQEDHKRFGARFGTLHTHPMHHIRADIDPSYFEGQNHQDSATRQATVGTPMSLR